MENKSTNVNHYQNGKIYLKIGMNLLINLIIFLILFAGLYNISLLSIIQSLYLLLTIFDWIFIIIHYLLKIILIPLGKLPSIKFCTRIWNILHFPAFLLIGIGLIYDIIKVLSSCGIVGIFLYYFIFVIVSSLFICFSLNDKKNIEKQYQLSTRNSNVYPLNEEEMHDIRSIKKE